MRLLRGRADTRRADREATRHLVDRVGETGEPAVRVWRPGRQVAFGRRDTRQDGHERAAECARERGFPPVDRSVGGRAVAYTETTVAFARVEPVDDIREGLDARYTALVDDVQRALWQLGVPAQRGEPDASFCPGAHSLQYRGKLVGIAQRVRSDAALVSGVLVVDGHDPIADVLTHVYEALDHPFDPGSVGSLARAGGDTSPERVLRTLEDTLVGDDDVRVEHVRQA
ncbi:lipoate--protein ligase family protein [Halospeciosus flavus]|uniref:Biotin/lipoate A/B protein ligase family protein n=1 Tax=Halospeciosus flavus TaxID=3032283 RepID=A0ABD5Z6U3_9EURY|nr:lipoate--protein ligase family protein [Halospeciosus flavus]